MRRNYEDELPIYLDMMEKLLTTNNGGDEYFVGDEVREKLKNDLWIYTYNSITLIEKHPRKFLVEM